MLRVLLAVCFVALIDRAATGKCEDCVNTGKHWCTKLNECMSLPCAENVKNILNCPSLPDPAYAYDDAFVRAKFMPLVGAAHVDQPDTCLKKQASTMTLYNTITTDCTAVDEGPETPCFMYTAFDKSQKIIVMAFRGTQNAMQLGEEIVNFSHDKVPFFDTGYVYEFFYKAFLAIWQAGLSNDLRQLKYLYPDFQLWVTGHSLGGALSSLAASFVVKTGLYDGKNIKLLTLGQPRTGDFNYSLWHQNTFPYSYRVVHHKDIVPHIPPQAAPTDDHEMWHHRTEIWYNNNMTVGSTYNVCQESDGPFCSNTQIDTKIEDHLHYFGYFMPSWGISGCP